MKYLLLVCGDSKAYEEMPADPGFLDDCKAWGAARGDKLIQSGGLEPPADATTVRVRDGEILLTDGPFVESREVVAGFSLIECDVEEEAPQLARPAVQLAGRGGEGACSLGVATAAVNMPAASVSTASWRTPRCRRPCRRSSGRAPRGTPPSSRARTSPFRAL
ncbi:hypothetical protein ABT120_09120 [Nonomuraea angiospora]|uniref:YciI family protein n=1 Tax=Nonomuraea angiospora TaxID=46172 RepID=UPI00331B31BD